MPSELTAAGVDPFDEAVYRAVLSRRSAAPAELVDEFGCSVERIARALDRLREHGLVGRLAGSRRRYAAIEPQAAVANLVRSRAAELDRVQAAAGQLALLFAATHSGSSEEIEIVSGSEALGRWFVRLQQEAQSEVITLDRPPYALTTSNPVEQTGIARGVRYRAVYAPEALEWPGVFDDIRELIRHGEQARVLPGLRIKLAIADRRLALMPLSLDLTDVRAAVIRPSTLLDGLIDYWEMCWRAAVPLEAPAEDPLGEEDRALLALLVSGLKDEAVARQLDWSVRTMRRRISRLYELLGAANRFQAGAIAVRKGWI
ncbi:transcriptional regulator [Catellatospora sp. TT07R-123]|uniref:helix-turn-helix domain-containing protein n=1 Tax=Catellatospora sp. TT07R-123 TaxID=2733863 RepID=UPI001B03AAFC|nr:helix-turn-helix domain-containing protein [Catellatospora sp. TT07R-123]GHJ48042.1 transcriptional regulator [Catellatospora sp. TT07R-123]